MDLSAVLASRRRMAEANTISSEGLGTKQPAAVSAEKSAESQKSALLAIGAQPPRSEYGFAGLLNQGATCYLNSLLQVMYCTSDLRKTLFEWDFSEPSPGDAQRFVSRQLQELFADMQLTAKAAVPTTRLTRSFGWKEGEAFMQNDIHECMSVLYDELVAQTVGIGNGESVSTFVRETSFGRMEHYTTCLGCNRTSVRPDEYKSLMLPVRGCPDMDSAFASLLVEEKLEGRNQYSCDECGGKRDALRGQRLPADGLPSTLYVSLNRFEFDYNTMQRRKVNDRLRPSLVVDMNKYVHVEGRAPASHTPATPTHAAPSTATTTAASADVPSKREKSAGDDEKSKETLPAVGGSGDVPPPATPSTNNTQAAALDESSPLLYDLVAVLMHIGAATAGHYFAYVRTQNGWLHFNDSTVTAIDESLVMKALGQVPPQPSGTGTGASAGTDGGAAGGAAAVPSTGATTTATTGGAAASSISSAPAPVTLPSAVHIHDASAGAYMLLYRRRDTLAAFLNQPDNNTIPADLRARMEGENGKYLGARKEWEIEQRKVRLRVFYDPKDLLVDEDVTPTGTGKDTTTSTAVTGASTGGGGGGAAGTAARSVMGAALLSSVVPDLPPLEAVDLVFGDEAPAEALLPAVLAAIEAAQKKAAGLASAGTGKGSLDSTGKSGSASGGKKEGFAPDSTTASAGDATIAGSAASTTDGATPVSTPPNPAAECPPTTSHFTPCLPLFRLRHYNGIKGITLAPVEPRVTDASASASDALVKHTGLVSGKQVVLERRRTADEPWPHWATGSLPLKIVLFHPIEGMYMPPRPINVPPGEMNVRTLRSVAASAVTDVALATGFISNPLQTPRIRLVILKQDSEDAAVILADDNQMLVPPPSSGSASHSSSGPGIPALPSPSSSSSPSSSTPAPPLEPASASSASASSASADAPTSTATGTTATTATATAATATSSTTGSSAGLSSLRLSPGDVVHVEICPLEGPGSDYTSSVGSVVAAAWDANVNTVSVTFNIPPSILQPDNSTLPASSLPLVTRNNVTGQSSGVVQIDQRLTLQALKEVIASFLGIKHDEFRVKRAQGSLEFKDTTGTLFYYSMVGGGNVWIDLGRPLGPDEYEFKVSLALPPLPTPPAATAPTTTDAQAGATTADVSTASTGPRPSAIPGGLAAASGARAGPASGGPGGAASASANTPAPGAPRYVTLGPLAMRAGASGADMKNAIRAAFGEGGSQAANLLALLPEDCRPGGVNYDLFLQAAGFSPAATTTGATSATGGASSSSTTSATEGGAASGGVAATIPFPAVSHMRLRERTGAATKLGRVLVDDKTLLVNYGGRLADGKEVVVQLTRHAESSRDGDLLLVPVRWNALSGKVTTQEESVFPAATPVKLFAGTVAHRGGVELLPGMVIKVAKPLAYHLADPVMLWGLRYTNYELTQADVDIITGKVAADAAAAVASSSAPARASDTPAAAPADGTTTSATADATPTPAPAPAPVVDTLAKCGWTIKSGDMLLFTLQDEFEHPDAFGKVSSAAGGAGGSGYGAGGSRRGGEDAFKIYSPEEQRKREAAAKERDEKEKKEREERQAALAASMAARMAAGGSLPAAPTPSATAPKPPPLPTNVRDSASDFASDFGSGSIVIDGVNIDKYYRFLQLGMEPAAVRAKMVADGVDPGLLPADL